MIIVYVWNYQQTTPIIYFPNPATDGPEEEAIKRKYLSFPSENIYFPSEKTSFS